MEKKNWIYILLCNLAGLFLLGTWLFLENHGFWFNIDKSIFYFFNNMLAESKAFMHFVAFVNLRQFDLVAFIVMLLILYTYYRKEDLEGKKKYFCIGVAMLLTAILVKQIDVFFPIHRNSPTLFFPDVNLVSKMSGWSTKCTAKDSFPGDHGIMLLIFTVYMWKYCGADALKKCLSVFIIFSLPRIMGGAHWFTDIAVGSISTVLIFGSWLLLTPISDNVIAWLQKKLPLNWLNKIS